MKSIEIYGQSHCGHCKRAVAYCEKQQLPFVYRDADDQATKREMFSRNPGAKSVPQIFIGNILVGGCDELVGYPLSHIQQMIGE